MRIIITGSTGFVGRHLIPVLIKEKHQILELTRNIDKSIQLFGELTNKYQVSDEQEALKNAIEEFNPEIVIHLAAFLTSSDDYKSMKNLIDSNITYLCRVLDALKGTKIKLFINTGTFAEYYKGDGVFDPAYLYSATKTASRSILDYYSKVYQFKQVTVVPYTIYGGKDTQKKIIDLIFDSISSAIPLAMSPGEQVLDFIHIDDVTEFYVTLLENEEVLINKSNFQLGTGIGHTLKEVSVIIEEVTNRKTNIHWGEKPYRPSDVMYAVANTNYTIGKSNWKPSIDLEMGVSIYLNNKEKL